MPALEVSMAPEGDRRPAREGEEEGGRRRAVRWGEGRSLMCSQDDLAAAVEGAAAEAVVAASKVRAAWACCRAAGAAAGVAMATA